MRIIDLSAGNRAIWWDKKEPLTTFIDIRGSVGPDYVCDSRNLPFEDGYFDMAVFDPPHGNLGATSQMAQTYGHHTAAEIRNIIEGTAKEAYRVCKENALLAFKWNDHDMRLNTVLPLFNPYWRPLFGHKVSQRLKHVSQTIWVMMLRTSGV